MLEEKFNTGSTQYEGEDCRLMVLYCIAPDNQRSKLQHYDCKSRATIFAVSFKKSREGNGALERIRTSDLCLWRAIQAVPRSFIGKLRFIESNHSNIHERDEAFCYFR